MNSTNSDSTPIFIVGAARSGTTLLGQVVLGSHPAVVYRTERNHTWRRGAAYSMSDYIDVCDQSQRQRQRIRQSLREGIEEGDGERLVEKTPANVLRLPFLKSVFPDAIIVHVIRDGRNVTASARRQWRGGEGKSLDSPRVRRRSGVSKVVEIVRSEVNPRKRIQGLRDVVELPAYAGRFVSFIYRHAFSAGLLPWGPRVPGLMGVRWAYSLTECCAWQWSECVRRGRGSAHLFGDQKYIEVRFEELIREPRSIVEMLCQKLGLSLEKEFLDEVVRSVKRPATDWRSEFSVEEVEAVETIIGSTLRECGYDLNSATG